MKEFNFDFENAVLTACKESSNVIEQEISKIEFSKLDISEYIQQVSQIYSKYSILSTSLVLQLYHSALTDYLKNQGE